METLPKERLKQIYDLTLDNGLSYSGNIEELDFYSLLCKSTANNQLYKIVGCNLCMFNYKHENDEAVLIIFSIPASLNSENPESKHISERIMNVLEIVEECFSTVDHMNLKNVKEDKFTYLTIVKKVKGEE